MILRVHIIWPVENDANTVNGHSYDEDHYGALIRENSLHNLDHMKSCQGHVNIQQYFINENVHLK